MVRWWRNMIASNTRFPHASGDGPVDRMMSNWVKEFSPREWGWSGKGGARRCHRCVFPTRVGMVRKQNVDCRRLFGFPHASGDGPQLLDRALAVATFSPREWGWSETSAQLSTLRYRFPHASGDGPSSQSKSAANARFSPREWGWSWAVRIAYCDQLVFPTRVGMVRVAAGIMRVDSSFPHASGDGP